MTEPQFDPPWKEEETSLTKAALNDYVERAVADLTGEKVARDEEGDLPFRFGSAMVYLRVVEGDELRVRFFAPMLSDVEESTDLLRSLNKINLLARAGRVAWTGKEVVAFMDLPGRLVDRAHLEYAVAEIGLLADHFDQQLQQDFGGRTVFGPDVPPKPRSLPGYL